MGNTVQKAAKKASNFFKEVKEAFVNDIWKPAKKKVCQFGKWVFNETKNFLDDLSDGIMMFFRKSKYLTDFKPAPKKLCEKCKEPVHPKGSCQQNQIKQIIYDFPYGSILRICPSCKLIYQIDNYYCYNVLCRCGQKFYTCCSSIVQYNHRIDCDNNVGNQSNSYGSYGQFINSFFLIFSVGDSVYKNTIIRNKLMYPNAQIYANPENETVQRVYIAKQRVRGIAGAGGTIGSDVLNILNKVFFWEPKKKVQTPSHQWVILETEGLFHKFAITDYSFSYEYSQSWIELAESLDHKNFKNFYHPPYIKKHKCPRKEISIGECKKIANNVRGTSEYCDFFNNCQHFATSFYSEL